MNKKLLALSLALALLLAGCGSSAAPASSGSSGSAGSSATPAPAVVVLTAEEAHKRMEESEGYILLDVRTAAEYEEAHIPGAVLLPNEEIGDTPPPQLPVLDAPLFIYCRSGNRSGQAAAKLASLGYTNIVDFGGISSWPYETEKGAYAPAEKAGTLTSFSAVDLTGIPRDERIFAGQKLTMVNVWGTFCGPCLREMPDLGRLAAAYADKGVAIVGIVADVSPDATGAYDMTALATARDLVAQTGANYLHLLVSQDLYNAFLYDVSVVPTTFFVNRAGEQVGERILGSKSADEWAALIDAALEAEA